MAHKRMQTSARRGSAPARRGSAPLGRRTLRAIAVGSVVGLLVLVLAGCGLRIPADPDGTLDRITGGQLRVGAATVDLPGAKPGDPASGPLGEVIEEFAETREADIVWTTGGEEELVEQLEAGELDLAVGDMTDQTPWADRVSVTRGYEIAGSQKKFVVLLPLGENALQSALEVFLDDRMSP